jgi:glycosyltransferase involved in cell wall biosynthesis
MGGFRPKEELESQTPAPAAHSFRIAVCLPELKPLQQVMRGEPSNGTYIVQKYVISGLKGRGHDLTYLAQQRLGDNVCTSNLDNPGPTLRTWSGSRWFDLVSRAAWKGQQVLQIPYLNVFSNYRLYDTCLQCLSGRDVIYERNGLYRIGVAKAARRLGLPYVLFVEADEILEHDIMGAPLTGLLRWRAKRMFRYNLLASDRIICVSQELKDHLASAWGVSPEKMEVFPNGVDTDRFRPDADARAAARASLGIDSDRPLVLFVGNFYEWHDVATTLDAFARIMDRHPDAHFVLIGDGARRSAMESRATELGISHAVQFTGLVPHEAVPGLMSAADIAVAPYPPLKHALWLSPLKLYEYLACGIPVVASSVGQIVHVIQEGSNGILTAPGDVAAMADALDRLISDPDLRGRMGRQAREDAVQRHSWDRYAVRLEKLCAAAIGDKATGRG